MNLLPRTIQKGRRLLGKDPIVFYLLLILLGGLWACAELIDEVLEGSTQSVDVFVLKSMRDSDGKAIGPLWLIEAARDVTSLGSHTVLILTVLAVFGYLLVVRKRHTALVLLGASIGGACVSALLKDLFARPRPDVVTHLVAVQSQSFPSGHSFMSATIYLTLCTFLAFTTGRAREKLYIMCIGLLIAGLVGLSRIYLGVHYPSDVVAGWLMGLTWATLCLVFGRWLVNRGAIEPESPSIDDAQ